MDKFFQSGLSIALLFTLGQCVADVPTGEELFGQQQVSVERVLVTLPGIAAVNLPPKSIFPRRPSIIRSSQSL